MSRILKFSLAALAMASVLVVATPADASFVLTLDDGIAATTVVIDEVFAAAIASDDGNVSTVGDAFAGAGTVSFSGTIGTFLTVITVGVSKPLIGPPPEIDLFNINVSGGAGVLTVSLTDTGFDSINAGLGFSSFRTQVGGTTDGSVDLNSYVDDGNTEFAMTEEMADLSFGPGPIAFSEEIYAKSGPMDLLDPKFSMTIVAAITHAGAGDITSFDINLQEVPEPTTFGLGLVALGGFFFMSSRRRKR